MGKYEYDLEYLKKNIFAKRVPFNRTQPEDMKLLEWVEAQGNFTQYVKRLIREDMERRNAQMKQYTVKPEFLPLWGDVDESTVITHSEVERLSVEWEKPIAELLEQLNEI